MAQAQDRLVIRSLRLLSRNSLVADVGCGLGGTVNLLASMGHRVFGFDPCPFSVAYARARATSPRAQLLVSDLATFSRRAHGARFDAVVLTEVLPHFADLGALFANCRALLRPGGLMLVHDLIRSPKRPAGRDGFHLRGALQASADGAGFDLVEGRDISNRTSPTLSRLARLLDEREEEIRRVFGPTRPEVGKEIEAYRTRLRALELDFLQEKLFYETTVLRCSARLTSDSVVLRPARRKKPATRDAVPRARES